MNINKESINIKRNKKYFRGKNKKSSYFEGWYFKHQKGENGIAFIPGMNIDSKGNKLAFIQVITNDNSYNIHYLYPEFEVSDSNLTICIGNSTFSSEGININIEEKDLKITGSIKYGELTKLDSNIMGPFSAFSSIMQCNHEIISLFHKLKGEIVINDQVFNFDGGIGYIEKDWGSSFPKEYTWVQCNDFRNVNCSVFAAVADIPFLGASFRGCIAIVYYHGMEYKLCTYNGVKIIKCDETGMILKQGKYKLDIQINSKNPQRLLAPLKGHMSVSIHEHSGCKANFRFYIDEKLEFNLESNNCNFENVSV